jgi:hypothetical protein
MSVIANWIIILLMLYLILVMCIRYLGRSQKIKNLFKDNKMKHFSILFTGALLLTSACSGPDVGTKLASSKLVGDGTLAQEQQVEGKTILMEPRVEDLTEKSFNIRYMELSFGNGVPANIRDLAIKQCKSLGKVAVYKTSTRGLIQGYTVKAYYECIDR